VYCGIYGKIDFATIISYLVKEVYGIGNNAFGKYVYSIGLKLSGSVLYY
jgi:hypothetical protein